MKNLLICTFVIALTFMLSACGSGKGTDTSQQAGSTGTPTKVKLVLDYLPNTNHTGFYVAKEQGYYKAAGLDVEIIEPADNTVTSLIATGKGDYGISYQEDVTYALAADEPLPIKAIAAVIQHNTSGFASYKKKNITKPKDFEGKTYAGWGAPSEEATIKAVMKAGGGDFSKLKIVTGDGSGVAALKDKVDLNWIFWAWDGIAAERKNIPLNYIKMADFDKRLDYYTPVIIASDTKLAQDPEVTKKFLAATKQGYTYSINNPEDAAKVLAKHVEGYDLAMLTASQKYLAGKYIDDAENWGEMKDEVWTRYTQFMREYGLIKKDIPAGDCYTNKFLK